MTITRAALVDGHSTDGTPEIARALLPRVRVITQTRKGKGNALACGFAVGGMSATLSRGARPAEAS